MSRTAMSTDTLTLHALRETGGRIRLPGSKSISNRALLIAAHAKGITRLHNTLDSDDTRYLRTALDTLGVQIVDGIDALHVTGCDGVLVPEDTFPDAQPVALQLGMAGTAYRPLTAALCLGRGEFDLQGNARMSERPIGHLVDALRALGAQIDYLGETGFPPLRIQGTGLTGGSISMRGDLSSQYLTSLLLSAPLLPSDLSVTIEGDLVSKPYLDITLALMQRFGAQIEHENYEVFRVAPGGYQAVEDLLIEGDASNATYFLAAGAISGRGMTVDGIGTDSVQGDVAFTDVLRHMGADVRVDTTSVSVSPGSLRAIDLDLNHIPDAAMTVAILALFADGTSTLRNLYNLRVKETDRLAALATELRKVGAAVVEGRDFLQITPPRAFQHATIHTYGDHRMAMCFALLALGGVPVTLEDPQCVNKTFPTFFDEFAKVVAAAE